MQGEVPDWQFAAVLETTEQALALVYMLSLPVTIRVIALLILEARVKCMGSPGSADTQHVVIQPGRLGQI